MRKEMTTCQKLQTGENGYRQGGWLVRISTFHFQHNLTYIMPLRLYFISSWLLVKNLLALSAG